jgi:hypothetical protein
LQRLGAWGDPDDFSVASHSRSGLYFPAEAHMDVDRREFLSGIAVLTGSTLGIESQAAQPASEGVPDWLPQQDPALVKEIVGVSHSDVKRVRELVERQPALANAMVDWGFGDWETALGAASHIGRREIAELLLAHGARPSIFSAAMLGQLGVVTTFVTASPGIQRTLGPHGINLLAHTRRRSGGGRGREVPRVGWRRRSSPTAPLEPADRDAVVGEYVFATGARDYFIVDVRSDKLGIERPGSPCLAGPRRSLAR